MSAVTIEVDKTLSGAAASFGTIDLRVVVVKTKAEMKKAKGGADTPEQPDEPAEATAGDEDDGDIGDGPLASYLERKKHGKQCIVFLVNGQRHDHLDKTFITRNLNFKYLRDRMMIIVELDNLAPEAVAEIVQGSRQGLFKGRVLDAIKDRIVAALRKDPDLVRLQQEAERKVSELDAGDQGVRDKLDKLIDAHHAAGVHESTGSEVPGGSNALTHISFGDPKRATVVVHAQATVGDTATLPVLTSTSAPTIRLVPDLSRTIRVAAIPETAWSEIESIDVRTEPVVAELTHTHQATGDGLDIKLRFEEPEDFDDDAFPVETTMRVYAKFRGHSELRQIERTVSVSRRGLPPPPPTPIDLKPTPTFLKVSSRQPVQMVAGGPSTHVKLRWDGLDSLASGSKAAWKFTGRCLSLSTFPAIHFTAPRNGRFEALVDAPRGLLPHLPLDFEIQAQGPNGASVKAAFKGMVVPAPQKDEARRITSLPPEAKAIRKPPYELRTVKKEQWNDQMCPWGDRSWTGEDPGAFAEPTDSAPLTLIVNEDSQDLVRLRESMAQRNLDEATVRNRLSQYQTHIAFHLYQMYLHVRALRDARPPAGTTDIEVEQAAAGPSDDEQHSEIRRVAATLTKVMEVSVR